MSTTETSPLFQFGMALVNAMAPQTKREIVESVASALSVSPGFWAQSGDVPTPGAHAVLELGPCEYAIALFENGHWMAVVGANRKEFTDVKRWATIPA